MYLQKEQVYFSSVSFESLDNCISPIKRLMCLRSTCAVTVEQHMASFKWDPFFGSAWCQSCSLLASLAGHSSGTQRCPWLSTAAWKAPVPWQRGAPASLAVPWLCCWELGQPHVCFLWSSWGIYVLLNTLNVLALCDCKKKVFSGNKFYR